MPAESVSIRNFVIFVAVVILVIAWFMRKRPSSILTWPNRMSSGRRDVATEVVVVFLLGDDSVRNAGLARRMLKEASNPALVRFVLPPGSPPSVYDEPVGLAGLPARRCCSLSRETFFIACGPSVFRMIIGWDVEIRNLSEGGAIMSHSLVSSRRASAEPGEPVYPLKQCSRISSTSPSVESNGGDGGGNGGGNGRMRFQCLPCHEIFFGWGAFGQTVERAMLCWENNPWWGLALSLAAEKENKKIRDVGPHRFVALRGPESRAETWGGANRLGVLRARVERIAGQGVIFPENEDFSLVQPTTESSNTSG